MCWNNKCFYGENLYNFLFYIPDDQLGVKINDIAFNNTQIRFKLSPLDEGPPKAEVRGIAAFVHGKNRFL